MADPDRNLLLGEEIHKLPLYYKRCSLYQVQLWSYFYSVIFLTNLRKTLLFQTLYLFSQKHEKSIFELYRKFKMPLQIFEPYLILVFEIKCRLCHHFPQNNPCVQTHYFLTFQIWSDSFNYMRLHFYLII